MIMRTYHESQHKAIYYIRERRRTAVVGDDELEPIT